MTINLPNAMKLVARYGDSRDGFNHFATLYKGGAVLGEAKIHYINRTWERYEFESVLNKLVGKTPELQTPEVKAFLAQDLTNWRPFKNVAALAMMGEVLGSTPEQKNRMKMQALKTLPGLDIPAEWESLPEAEKTERLNKVIGLVRTVGEKKETN